MVEISFVHEEKKKVLHGTVFCKFTTALNSSGLRTEIRNYQSINPYNRSGAT